SAATRTTRPSTKARVTSATNGSLSCSRPTRQRTHACSETRRGLRRRSQTRQRRSPIPLRAPRKTMATDVADAPATPVTDETDKDVTPAPTKDAPVAEPTPTDAPATPEPTGEPKEERLRGPDGKFIPKESKDTKDAPPVVAGA